MPNLHDHVLLVEDHTALAGLNALGLEDEGYVVTVALDGLAALELARAACPAARR
jgi:DNA-binding response OmpR family regulator